MQLTLHILRTKEAHFHPLPPPPDLPTDLDVKQELDLIDSEDEEISDSEAGIQVADNDSIDLVESGEDEDDGDGEKPKKKKGFKGALQRAAQRVTGDGSALGQTRQKVRLLSLSELIGVRVADAAVQVGEKVDKRLYHSKAPDDGSNICEHHQFVPTCFLTSLSRSLPLQARQDFGSLQVGRSPRRARHRLLPSPRLVQIRGYHHVQSCRPR